MRRAQPSSSISAAAVFNWSPAIRTIERPSSALKIFAETGLAGEIVKHERAVRHADGAADAGAGREQIPSATKVQAATCS